MKSLIIPSFSSHNHPLVSITPHTPEFILYLWLFLCSICAGCYSPLEYLSGILTTTTTNCLKVISSCSHPLVFSLSLNGISSKLRKSKIKKSPLNSFLLKNIYTQSIVKSYRFLHLLVYQFHSLQPIFTTRIMVKANIIFDL